MIRPAALAHQNAAMNEKARGQRLVVDMIRLRQTCNQHYLAGISQARTTTNELLDQSLWTGR